MKKIIAILLAFLLTGALILFSVTFLAQQVIQPAMSEEGAPVSGTVIREEKRLAFRNAVLHVALVGVDAEDAARTPDGDD